MRSAEANISNPAYVAQQLEKVKEIRESVSARYLHAGSDQCDLDSKMKLVRMTKTKIDEIKEYALSSEYFMGGAGSSDYSARGA